MKKLLVPLLLCMSCIAASQTNPAITRWLQNTSVTARHYVSGNSTPINDASLVNVQSVKYSATSAYATTTGLPGYITGPFLDGNPSLATTQNAIFKFPLTPTQNTGTATATSGGNIGIFINGVAFFDYRDGASWQNSTQSLKGGPYGGTGDGVWNRDAVVGEKGGFDCAKGHPAMGNYHHHQNPSAFKLDLSVISTVCNLYNADGLYAVDSTQHSPLIGLAYDGFPIYGAYGYKNVDGTGGIVRMKSGYSLRNISIRNTYYTGQSVTAGPNVSATYPLGYFKEDYQYNATSASTPDYLDDHNGRFCVTPEYPNGTYCYFATVDANWNSAYPYLIGPAYYGNKTAAKVTSITETVTTYPVTATPSIYIAAYTKTICSGTTVAFTSSTYNGGLAPTYQWKVNGVNAGMNSNSFSSSTLANGDVVSCVVTTAAMTTATSNTITMTVNSSVTPAITIAASSTSICSGTSVLFTAVPSNGGSSPAYQWKKNSSNVGTNSTSYSDNTLANGDVITCIMTGNASCATASTATSNSVALTVNSLPTVTASNVSGCSGNSIALSGTPSGGTWSVANPYTGSATTYTHTYTDGNGCSNTSSSANITVNSLPAVTASNVSGCSGNSIALSGTPAGGTWSVANPYTGPSTTYTHTYTDGNGCTNTSAAANITENSLPVVTAANVSGCVGNSIALSGTPAGGTWSVANPYTGSATTYTHSYIDGNGCMNTSTDASISVNALPSVSFSGLDANYTVASAAANLTGIPAGGIFTGTGISGTTFNPSSAGVGGPYAITYSFSDGNGCSNSASQTTTVSNCSAPAIPGTITSVGGSAKMCPGDTKSYKISVVSGATSYTWIPPAGGILTTGQGTKQISINYTSGFIAADSLKVSASNSCGSSSYKAIKISRNTPATPGTVTGQNYGVCGLSNVAYSTTSVSGITYNWTYNTGTAIVVTGQGSSNITSEYVSGFLSGILSVTAANGCGTSSAKTKTIYAKPDAPETITGITLVCPNQSAVPYSISPVAFATTYVWTGPAGSHISDGTTTSAGISLTTASTSVTVNFGPSVGNLSVKAKNSCTTGASKSLSIGLNTGCRESNPLFSSGRMDVVAYPNPATSVLILSFHTELVTTYSISLKDIVGKSQLKFEGKTISGENSIPVNIEKLARGLYILEVNTGNRIHISQVIVD